VIDIHTHLLPGVDDGSPNAEHSSMVLGRMAGEGVTTVVCTPHLNASQAAGAPYEAHAALLDDLRRRAPASVQLLGGWEIMLDQFGVDLTPEYLSLGGSRARLVEFSRRGLPLGATEELLRLRATGVIPVVAHPERYQGCTIDLLIAWRELGAVLQGDALALLGAGPMTQLARTMLAEGLTDILASDNHGDRRSLSTARLWLEEIGALDQARILTDSNARCLLEGKPLTAVAPVHLQTSVLERLKSLFSGRRRAADA
jgi:protein-tyrosine phosphatase